MSVLGRLLGGAGMAAVAGVAFGLSAGCSSSSASAEGTAGAACYPNGTCNAGLACKSAVCVTAGGGGSSSASQSGSGSGSSGGSASQGGSGSSSGASGVVPSCAQSPGECKCSSVPFELTQNENPVPSCDATGSGSGSWLCTYDINSAGQTTTCTCYEYQCSDLTARCGVCGFNLTEDILCMTADAGVTYCLASNPSTTEAMCQWSDSAPCASGWTQVSGCSATPPKYTAPARSAASCAGLDWAP